MTAAEAFGEFVRILQRLRSPSGCKWDRQQTPQALRANLLEEAYECVSAIDDGDDANLREELGDLYLLTTMLSLMKEEAGSFRIEDVLAGISEKLVRRHPHVFGEAKKDSVEEILQQWHEIKTREKAAGLPSQTLDGIPASLPPLERANEMQKKASRVGFDWDGPEPVWGKLAEEIAELEHAFKDGDMGRIEAEVGDVLFTVVNLARLLKVDPAVALNASNRKFERRFGRVEERLRARGLEPAQAGFAAMDAIWEELKAEE